MKILINIIAAIPIIFMLLFSICAVRDGLRNKAWDGRELNNDEVAIRFFLSVVSFIITAVLLIGLALINKVL